MKKIIIKKDYQNLFETWRSDIEKKGWLKPSPWYGSINLTITFLLYILGLFLIGKISILPLIFFFYLLFVEVAYISHDLIHNQYFKSKKMNRFFSYIFANLMIGLSRSWWMKKHNNEHHTYTNSDIHDTDIRDYDEIFTKNPGKSAFFYKHRMLLFWCASSILYFNLIILSYRHILIYRKYGELILNLVFLILFLSLLSIQYGFIMALVVFFVIGMMTGVHLAFVFMTNHIGMEIIDGKKIQEYAWLDLQTRTSRNIRGGLLIQHIFGGLNCQIEHHLFPQASRWNIRKISYETQKFCRKNGIPYHEVSFGEALREIYLTLKTGKTL